MQAKFQSCCKTLTAYCRNVYANLSDDSKRKINCSNKAFQERVAVIPGGVDFLNQVGFQARSFSLLMHLPFSPSGSCFLLDVEISYSTTETYYATCRKL